MWQPQGSNTNGIEISGSASASLWRPDCGAGSRHLAGGANDGAERGIRSTGQVDDRWSMICSAEDSTRLMSNISRSANWEAVDHHCFDPGVCTPPGLLLPEFTSSPESGDVRRQEVIRPSLYTLRAVPRVLVREFYPEWIQHNTTGAVSGR